MKKFKLILKSILLWFTAMIALFSICSIDTILDKGWEYLFSTVIVTIVLITICSFTINEEEFKIISGYNLYNKLLNLYED